MTTSDVPTAVFMSTPSRTSAGTIRNPPPTPTSPVSTPTASASITITRAALTVTADAKSRTYDGSVYSPFTSIIAGFVNGDTPASLDTPVTIGTTATMSSPAGLYPITVTNAIGLGSSNYAITYVSGTLTVNLAGLLVTAGDTNKAYGVQLQPLGYVVSGLLNSDNVTNVTLTSTGSVSNAPIGAYVISANLAQGSGLTNYNIGYSNGTLTVNAASLLITAGSTNKVYGTTLNLTDYTVSGLLNADSVTNVTLLSAGSGSNAPAGSYAISASSVQGVGLTNYSIGYSNGTLSVNPASLLIALGSTNKVYGTTLNPTAYTVSGLLNADSVTNVTLTSAGSVSNAPVGSYAITVSLVEGAGLTNYDLGYSNATMTVSAANLLRSWFIVPISQPAVGMKPLGCEPISLSGRKPPPVLSMTGPVPPPTPVRWPGSGVGLSGFRLQPVAANVMASASTSSADNLMSFMVSDFRLGRAVIWPNWVVNCCPKSGRHP